ncbi:pyridoxine 5'-phosphate synthase [Campylobacter sp. JMF_02 ED1]|uniref:pyridoxine 5'-phosphate synthase n=1 Tax=unclassified Campylobacter TaxID=2593542 RepID=UPI0022E9F53C|nr:MULTISPECIES: pyridoxine 5'-phosphate synthase [unclassified Campylobacter]MDA3049230.1 pyridoxine 5'-phosphate synthase [Campylobacter sp. JMF_15 NE4]MDA3051345.1 pyridoxine 5'-phosphate synthase [Campylobacter sp. JMF_02 ED1]
MLLGVNIDHVAVLREARAMNDPDILMAAYTAISAGANQITLHLHEDRRHINEDDIGDIVRHSKVPVNVECSGGSELLEILVKAKPYRITLVPHSGEDCGLNLHSEQIASDIEFLQHSGVRVGLFIEPVREVIDMANDFNVRSIELRTGTYSALFATIRSNLAFTPHAIKAYNLPLDTLKSMLKDEISKLRHMSAYAKGLGMNVTAGGGLNYQNVSALVKNSEISLVNIGQSIISRAIFVGLENAIKEMKEVIR